MATYNATGMLTVTAAADLSEYLRVTAGGAIAGATDIDIGVTEGFTQSGDLAAICAINAPGTQKVIAADSVSAGDRVYCAADGEVSAAVTTLIRGIAITSGAANEVIEILPLMMQAT